MVEGKLGNGRDWRLLGALSGDARGEREEVRGGGGGGARRRLLVALVAMSQCETMLSTEDSA